MRSAMRSTMPRGRERVVRDPVDEAAQLLLERREVELLLDVLQAVVQAGPDRHLSAQTTPSASRGPSGTATMSPTVQVESRRHAVRIGLVEGDRHQNIDDALCHAGDSDKLLKGKAV